MSSVPSLFPVAGAGRRAQRGLSLLEAVLAVAIAAVALVALARTAGQSALAGSRAAQLAQAHIVAASVLAGVTWADEVATGAEGREGPWRWRVTLQPADVTLLAGGTATAVPVGRLEIEVWREDEDVGAGPALAVVMGWKPWRAPR